MTSKKPDVSQIADRLLKDAPRAVGAPADLVRQLLLAPAPSLPDQQPAGDADREEIAVIRLGGGAVANSDIRALAHLVKGILDRRD